MEAPHIFWKRTHVLFDIVLLPPSPLTSHFFDLTFDSKFDSGLRDHVTDRGTVSETA